MPSPELTIGALADRTGLAVSAIRFYEDKGLITPGRNAAGHRRYNRADLRRLSFIKITQELGFPLSRIASALATLPDGRTPTKADWTRLSHDFRADLDARIDRLVRTRDLLTGCIGCGCLSLKACALYNPQDALGEDGPGPRKLV